MREDGYYWIKINRNDYWKIAYFDIENGVGKFRFKEDNLLYDTIKESDVCEICENKLEIGVD